MVTSEKGSAGNTWTLGWEDDSVLGGGKVVEKRRYLGFPTCLSGKGNISGFERGLGGIEYLRMVLSYVAPDPPWKRSKSAVWKAG